MNKRKDITNPLDALRFVQYVRLTNQLFKDD
jgi:hypothetical protein